MSPLRRALKIFAWLGAGLTTALVLLVLALWALGTRGVPLTADLAVKLMSGQLAIARAEGGWFGPIVLEGLRYDSPGSTVEVDRLMLDCHNPVAALQSRLRRRAASQDLANPGRQARPVK